MSRSFTPACPECQSRTDNMWVAGGNILACMCRNDVCRKYSEWIYEFSHLTRPSLVSDEHPRINVTASGIRAECACGGRAVIQTKHPLSPETLRLYMRCKNSACECMFVVVVSHRRPECRSEGLSAEKAIQHLLGLFPRKELERVLSASNRER